MHLGGTALAKASKKHGRVPIEHLKLDYASAQRTAARPFQKREDHDEVTNFVNEIVHAEQRSKAKATISRIEAVNRTIARAKVVAEGKTVATGITALKRRGPPLAALFDQDLIGGDELRAAQEITRAFMALCGALMMRPQSMERTDKGSVSSDWPAALAYSVRQYQSWANHWSDRAKRGDKTLEIVIAAIIDEREFSVLARDLGIRRTTPARAVVCGLRDYAARAGWVDGRLAAKWKEEAESVFPRSR